MFTKQIIAVAAIGLAAVGCSPSDQSSPRPAPRRKRTVVTLIGAYRVRA
jgi:hypothetical protein